MGKLAHIVRQRTCLVCQKPVETSSKGLKAHVKACVAIAQLAATKALDEARQPHETLDAQTKAS